MPHYKDGTEAKVGDFAKGSSTWDPTERKGMVIQIHPGTDTCNLLLATVSLAMPAKIENGTLVPFENGQPKAEVATFTLNAKDCEKIG